MTVLVAGQDPAGAAAVADRLGGDAAAVDADGVPVPLGEHRGDHDVLVYVLDACVPADAVDAIALGRLRADLPTVLAATGADVYPHAAATLAESGRRLGGDVVSVQPDSGGGFAELRAALAAPAPACPASPAGAPTVPGPPGAALERADRSAYLRSAIARIRAALLADSAEGFRRHEDEPGDDVGSRLTGVVLTLERSLGAHLRAAYRGTFAGWPDPPEPAVPVLPRPDPPAAPADRRRPEDLAVLILGASAGLGIGRAVAAPLEVLGALRWLALPISLAVGLAAAVWLLRMRRRSTARAERRSWADAAAAGFRQRVEVELAAALVAAEADAALRLARGPGTDREAGASNEYGP
ncbi:hypothetical protein [Tsukamurella ocularis]|uniref:hypothetical protein n=1 Tax=Tsukamurella ocularis TaxID=1970234 RepID=UPI002166E920|nr:hypothetical protein [Tsukamurella ocularis]MCS3781447.1 hypothetical protein [Tsukamurella ocularis]MCS3787819.1 hypothetical protein [Tsukamurella ocularis]MCS3851113.1 hypothetical protein [Tsukamurella ocularis]